MKHKIEITKDGPYVVTGEVPLAKGLMIPDNKGASIEWEKGESLPVKTTYKLCRCGNSKNKPFCDDAHLKIKFDGTETAGKEKYMDLAETFDGPELVLTDARVFCSSGRFCDRLGGIWNLNHKSGDAKLKEIAIQQAHNCPSGRLVEWDKKTGKPLEPNFEPSIMLAEDLASGVSGPICVRGGIELVSSDGTMYEVRNRMALCRCGESDNKPFCDGNHIPAKFNDGDKSINS